MSTVFLKLQPLEHPGEIQQLGDPATDVGSQIMRPPSVGLLMQFVGNVTKWGILRLYAILKRSLSQLSQATTLSVDLQGHPEHTICESFHPAPVVGKLEQGLTY